MRWLVEVTPLGKTEKESVYVEADTWQKALQAARSQRGESNSMSGFSIELLDEGCRAVDPMSRLRYEVHRAPEESGHSVPPPVVSAHASAPAASTGARAPSVPPGPQVPSVSAGGHPPSVPPPQHPSSIPPSQHPTPVIPRPVAQVASVPKRQPVPLTRTVAMAGAGASGSTAGVSASGTVEKTPPPPALAAPPSVGPVAAARMDVSPLVPSQVIFKREQDASEAVPLTYREYVYVVPPGTTETIAETLLQTQLQLVQTSLERVTAGKLVNLAVFDVVFQGKPPVPPLATLMWKDWRGAAVVTFPRSVPAHGAAPLAAATPIRAQVAPEPPPQPALAPTPIAAPVIAAPVIAAPVIAAPVIAAPVIAAPVVAAAVPATNPLVSANPLFPVAPAPQAQPAAAPARAGSSARWNAVAQPDGRIRGEDLIADLFEAMHDLHFLRDAVEGGDFCLALALEKLPSHAGIVHLYDIDHREFIVTNTYGAAARELLLQRFPEGDPMLAAAMRKRSAVVIANAAESEATTIDRYVVLGGARSLIVAPVMQSGRFLGAIELLNPLDGQPFTEIEGNALTYIGEQLAEFVATRGIVTDPERISAGK